MSEVKIKGPIDFNKLRQEPKPDLFKRPLSRREITAFDAILDHTAVGEPIESSKLQEIFGKNSSSFASDLVSGIKNKLKMGDIINISTPETSDTYPPRAQYIWNPNASKKYRVHTPARDYVDRRNTPQKSIPRPEIDSVFSTSRRLAYLQQRQAEVWNRVRVDIVLRMLSQLVEREGTIAQFDEVIATVNPAELLANVLKDPIEYEILSLQYTNESAERAIRQAFIEGIEEIKQLDPTKPPTIQQRRAQNLYRALIPE